MPTQTEILRMAVEFQGRERLTQAREECALLREQMRALGPAVASSDPALLKLASALKTTEDRAAALERQLGKGGGGTAGLMNTLQGTSRAVQDFTSSAINGGLKQGLFSITNNVEQVGQGIGKLAGLSTATAAAIGSIGTFAIVGLQIALPVLESLAAKMGLFRKEIDPTKGEIDKLKEKIKELSEKEVKLPIDITQLDEAKRKLAELTKAKEAFDELMGLKSKAQKESESRTAEIIGESEGGAAKTIQRAEAAEKARIDAQTPMLGTKKKALDEARAAQAEAERERQAAARADPFGIGQHRADAEEAAEEAGKAVAAAEKEVNDIQNANKAKAEANIGKARNDAARMAKLLEATGDRRDADTAAKLRTATPEAIKAEEERKRDADLRNANRERDKADKARRDQELDRKREEQARTFQDRFNADRLAGKGWDAGTLAKELGASHFADDPASVAAVMKKLEREFTEAVAKRRGQIGGTDADAIADLKREAAAKAKAKEEAGDWVKPGGKTPEQIKAEAEERQKEARAEANAHRIAGAGMLDEQARAYLDLQEQRRKQVEGLKGATRKGAIRAAAQSRDPAFPNDPDARNPILTPEEARQRAEDEIMRQLSSRTVRDEDGNPLTVEQRRAAAKAMIGNIEADRGIGKAPPKPPGGLRSIPAAPPVGQALGAVDQFGGVVAGVQGNQLAMSGEVNQLRERIANLERNNQTVRRSLRPRGGR